MTELKQATIAMIEDAPEDYMEKIFQAVKDLIAKFQADKEKKREAEIFAYLDELFAKEPPMTEEEKKFAHERAESFSRACAEFRALIGNDIPWANEEEMIEELRQDRRERMKNANYA